MHFYSDKRNNVLASTASTGVLLPHEKHGYHMQLSSFFLASV
jgi:hypothetical protein